MRRPACPQNGPYVVMVEQGREYLWCACGLSKSQPWFTFVDDEVIMIAVQAVAHLEVHFEQQWREGYISPVLLTFHPFYYFPYFCGAWDPLHNWCVCVTAFFYAWFTGWITIVVAQISVG